MGFLKSLFGKENKVTEDEKFTKDFKSSLKRYLSVTGENDIEYEFKDKKGNVIPPSYAFEGAYNEWKTIQSVWDKKSVIYSALDEIYFKNLDKWQIIERYTIDRYPQKAIQFVKEYTNNEDFKNIDFLTSFSKCMFTMSQYEKGIEYAKKGLEIDQNSKKTKVILADLLHLTNEHDKAHEIYSEVLRDSKLKEWDKKEINVFEIVEYNNDILNSSVYAVSLLNNDETDEEMWNKVAGEFYYCPYFRSQHAFWLIKKGDNLKGIAKLISLTQEFPTYKDGIVNAKNVILQFRKQMNSEDLWSKELDYLTNIITKNNWE